MPFSSNSFLNPASHTHLIVPPTVIGEKTNLLCLDVRPEILGCPSVRWYRESRDLKVQLIKANISSNVRDRPSRFSVALNTNSPVNCF